MLQTAWSRKCRTSRTVVVLFRAYLTRDSWLPHTTCVRPVADWIGRMEKADSTNVTRAAQAPWSYAIYALTIACLAISFTPTFRKSPESPPIRISADLLQTLALEVAPMGTTPRMTWPLLILVSIFRETRRAPVCVRP